MSAHREGADTRQTFELSKIVPDVVARLRAAWRITATRPRTNVPVVVPSLGDWDSGDPWMPEERQEVLDYLRSLPHKLRHMLVVIKYVGRGVVKAEDWRREYAENLREHDDFVQHEIELLPSFDAAADVLEDGLSRLAAKYDVDRLSI